MSRNGGETSCCTAAETSTPLPLLPVAACAVATWKPMVRLKAKARVTARLVVIESITTKERRMLMAPFHETVLATSLAARQ